MEFVIEHKMYILIFSANSIEEIFNFKNKSAKCYHKYKDVSL